MSNLKVEIKEAKILTFEAGNTRNVLEGGSSVRAVCAIGTNVQSNGYKVKILFKGDDAKEVYNYMTARKKVGEHRTNETITVCGSIREIRDKYKEIVIDEVTYIKFNLDLSFELKPNA